MTKKNFRISKTKKILKSSEKMGFHWFQPQLQPSSISIRKNRKQLGIRRVHTTMTGERIVYLGRHPNDNIKKVLEKFFWGDLRFRDMDDSSDECQKTDFLHSDPNCVKSSGGSNETSFSLFRRLKRVEKLIFVFSIFFLTIFLYFLTFFDMV